MAGPFEEGLLFGEGGGVSTAVFAFQLIKDFFEFDFFVVEG